VENNFYECVLCFMLSHDGCVVILLYLGYKRDCKGKEEDTQYTEYNTTKSRE